MQNFSSEMFVWVYIQSIDHLGESKYLKKIASQLDTVAHTCNCSYLLVWTQEDYGSRTAGQKS
jgi:hypothetical protein